MHHKTLLHLRAASPTSSSSKEMLHRLRTRDITLRVPSKDGLLRFVFCATSHLWHETIRRHNLWSATGGHTPFLELLGTHLSFTNMLAALQDGEERVACRLTSDEATICTEALALGECRSYVLPEYNGELIESGRQPFPLKVDRILYKQRQPFTSVVNADLRAIAAPVEGDDERIAAYGVAPIPSGSGVGSPAAAEIPQPPLSLNLHEASLDSLVSFFSHNMTAHGYNFLRRSNGCVPALMLRSRLLPDVLKDTPVDQSLSEERLQCSCDGSYGILAEPLAAGNGVDWVVWRIQQALALAMTTPARYPALETLHSHTRSEHTACQYMLSLISGDYKGSYDATVAARQFTSDPVEVAKVLTPLRKSLGITDIVIPLDAAASVRTGLDFFCRCSTTNVLQTLVAAPEVMIQSLRAENEFRCTYCGKVHRASPEEWAHLEAVRTKSGRGKRS